MTFDQPWVLFIAWLPFAWLAWEWRQSGRRGALTVKAIAVFCVLLALAQPRLKVFESKVALAVLVDTSASVSAADLQRSSSLVTGMEKARGSNTLSVLPFAQRTRRPAPAEISPDRKRWDFRQTAGAAGHGTNIESAVREAVAALPAGMVRRVALISDGHENQGSAARAIWQAQQLGIPIDTYALGGRPRPNLRIESVGFPSQVFSGERFPIDIALRSPSKAAAAVEISAEGKSLGSSKVQLDAGMNRFRVHTSLTSAGAVDLAGKISAEGLGEARFEQAITLRRPNVLLVSQDPATSEQHLVRTLEANQFTVQHGNAVPEKFDDYQLVVINNWDLEAIPPGRKAALEDFVHKGGGLLWIAGERNVYVENKTTEDALERVLPAKLAPPRTPEGTCVVLIIDKSSSMEGKKMELARLAAIGVIENLRSIDQVGVLIFDNSFQWAVPIRKAEDRSLIKRLVAGITPDGGTQIAPALSEAYRKILPLRAIYKHIVLLTDGISEEGDSMSLSREASVNHVTISTVGLGQDVNRAYLEKIASFSQGKAYFLNDPSGLEQILLRDVMEHTGSTAVEKNAKPIVVKQAEILDAVGIDTAPLLKGYVRYTVKPTAESILNIDQREPLLVRWQNGLGRAAVFTSDAKNRWAANWVTWPGFDRLWTNVFRDLLPHAQESEARAEYDSAGEALVVDYRMGRHVEEPATIPDIFVFGPNGFRAPMKVNKTAAGAYRARIPIGATQGLFRVRPLSDSRAFPEVGFYREEDELLDYGNNEALLRQISSATGGRFNPATDAFRSDGKTVPSTMQLWPGLLGLAVLLNIAELLMRKWRGIMEGARIWRPAEAA